MTFLPVVDRELYLASRRASTYRVRVAVSAVGIAAIAVLAVVAAEIPPADQGKLMVTVFGSLAFAYCLFVGVAVTADCLSEEKREGTLGLLFLTDLNGYDVVLGKVAASSLKSVYGLLAVIPMMSLAMLLGGVTGAELARVAAILLNTLFFSVAAGIFVSAISRNERKAMFGTASLILLMAAGPYALAFALWNNANWNPFTGPERAYLISSPIFAFTQAFVPNLSPRLFRWNEFWQSISITHVLSWALLAVSSIVLPSVCKDRPKSGRGLRWWEWRQRWNYGGTSKRALVRARLLDRNPFVWLAGRDQTKVRSVWLFLGSMALLWVPAWAVSFDTVILSAAFLLFCSHGVVKLWLVSEVCSRWVEDRRSGALELLLSSPLRVGEIAHGQNIALRSQFGKAVGLILTLDLVFWYVVKTEYNDPYAPRLLAMIPAGMVMLLADLAALRWVAMWLSLTRRTLGQAMAGAWVRILGLPWLIYLVLYVSASLVFYFSGRPGPALATGEWALIWMGIGLVCDLACGLQAKWNFLSGLRTLASERFSSKIHFSLAHAVSGLARKAFRVGSGKDSPKQATGAFPLSRGAHAPSRVAVGASPTASASTERTACGMPTVQACGEAPQAARASAAGAASSSRRREARALPSISSASSGIGWKRLLRFSLAWPLAGAALLAMGWLTWHRWSLARQVKAALAAIQKAGYPVTEDDLANWHPPLPVAENRASVVGRATFGLHSLQWLPRELQARLQIATKAESIPRSSLLPPDVKSAIAVFVSSNHSALSIISSVTNHSRSRYDEVWSLSQNNWWAQPLGKVNELLHLLRLHAMLQAEEGQPDSAIQSLNVLLAVTQSLADEPMLRPRGLTGGGLNAAASVLERLVTRQSLSDSQLQGLFGRFSALQTSNRLVRALAGERFTRLKYFQSPSSQLFGMWMPGAPRWQTSAYGAIQALRDFIGMGDRDLLVFLRLMEDQMRVARLPFPENLAQAAKLMRPRYDQNGLPFDRSSRLAVDLPSALAWECDKESRLAAVMAGLAVERYRLRNQGRLPESLEQLVPEFLKSVPRDPYDGKPIRYKPRETGFVVYGIGMDGKDDGGKEYQGFSKRASDVTFTVER